MSPVRTDALRACRDELRDYALSFPDAWEDHPWGEDVYKVGKKIFVFLNVLEKGLYVTVKLPGSNGFALAEPFVTPTGYGLARAGWVTATFAPRDEVPVDLLRLWIEESFRAVAPKRLVATLVDGGGSPE